MTGKRGLLTKVVLVTSLDRGSEVFQFHSRELLHQNLNMNSSKNYMDALFFYRLDKFFICFVISHKGMDIIQ